MSQRTINRSLLQLYKAVVLSLLQLYWAVVLSLLQLYKAVVLSLLQLYKAVVLSLLQLYKAVVLSLLQLYKAVVLSLLQLYWAVVLLQRECSSEKTCYHPNPHFFFLSWTNGLTQFRTCAHDKQLDLNVHVKSYFVRSFQQPPIPMAQLAK